MVVTLTLQLAGLYFGRYVLKLNPLLLLGGLSGAQTFTAGLAAVQENPAARLRCWVIQELFLWRIFCSPLGEL